MRATSLVLVVLVGCASADGDGADSPKETTKTKINQCVTPGASYERRYVEHPGGTCGPVTTSIVNVRPDGMLEEQDGCTGAPRYDGCNVYVDSVCKKDGLTAHLVGKATWAPDGSSGTAKQTITVEGSSSCKSTYDITMTRL